MATLLLAEHDNKTLREATPKAVTAAKALGGDVHLLVAGNGCRPVAEAGARRHSPAIPFRPPGRGPVCRRPDR